MYTIYMNHWQLKKKVYKKAYAHNNEVSVDYLFYCLELMPKDSFTTGDQLTIWIVKFQCICNFIF